MSERRERLQAELRLLDLEERYNAATADFRAERTPQTKAKFKKAKRALVDFRRESRLAEGRHEGTGVA